MQLSSTKSPSGFPAFLAAAAFWVIAAHMQNIRITIKKEMAIHQATITSNTD